MNQDLAEELEYMIDLLAKSGFFSCDEIIEILQDQFIEEDIDFSKVDISLNNYSNDNFSKLEKVFNNLASQDIVAIHNCGYDIEEGVGDAFELFVHLTNNKFNPIGFCFYTFDIYVGTFFLISARASGLPFDSKVLIKSNTLSLYFKLKLLLLILCKKKCKYGFINSPTKSLSISTTFIASKKVSGLSQTKAFFK